MQQGGVETSGQRVVILGSGGAARAIAFALGVEGKIEHLTLLGVDEQERTALANDLKAKTSILLHDRALTPETLQSALAQAQLLIHCTPIGMHPKVDESCVPKHLLHRDLTVMDIVYNPLNTRLLQDAQAAGCRTIQGINMFLYQAVGQFELWTGKPAPIEVMRKVLTSHFS